MGRQQFTQNIVNNPKSAPDEHSLEFWNPGRVGMTFAGVDFRRKLHDMDPELEAVMNHHTGLWVIWVKKLGKQTRLCQGWKLLFVVHDGNQGYVPLDERTLAKLFEISGRKWGNGLKYFDAVMRERQRATDAQAAFDADEERHQAYEYFDHTQPFVGYGTRQSASKVVGQ